MNRIYEELKKLATFSSTEVPAITRILYTDKDLEARDYFIGLCEEINLKVTTDAIGNIFARWEGLDSTLSAVATGSHIDAIPLSGMYDGTVGVFGGLAAIRTLKNEGYKPTRSIELILFTSEEPTRFKIGCLGSRMLGGQMKVNDVLKLTDDKGELFDEVRKKAGYTSSLSEVELSKNHYKAFVELHIEQGPILEKEDLDIGIVTKIAAPSSLKITLTGEGGHAGAVLMENRKDAGIAGAEVMIAVEQVAKESESKDTVATVGIFDVTPRAVNSIPKEVYMEVDLRGTSVTARNFALNKLQEDIKVICEKRDILYDIKMVNCDPPAICDTDLVNIVENVSNKLGFKSKRMISRAYHDTLFMALVAPTTMIFIPCRGGVSHRPDEYSSPAQIEKGVETLKNTLKTLTFS
jgi:hydantoinase/carbamoylase family amidase